MLVYESALGLFDVTKNDNCELGYEYSINLLL